MAPEAPSEARERVRNAARRDGAFASGKEGGRLSETLFDLALGRGMPGPDTCRDREDACEDDDHSPHVIGGGGSSPPRKVDRPVHRVIRGLSVGGTRALTRAAPSALAERPATRRTRQLQDRATSAVAADFPNCPSSCPALRVERRRRPSRCRTTRPPAVSAWNSGLTVAPNSGDSSLDVTSVSGGRCPLIPGHSQKRVTSVLDGRVNAPAAAGAIEGRGVPGIAGFTRDRGLPDPHAYRDRERSSDDDSGSPRSEIEP